MSRRMFQKVVFDIHARCYYAERPGPTIGGIGVEYKPSSEITQVLEGWRDAIGTHSSPFSLWSIGNCAAWRTFSCVTNGPVHRAQRDSTSAPGWFHRKISGKSSQ